MSDTSRSPENGHGELVRLVKLAMMALRPLSSTDEVVAAAYKALLLGLEKAESGDDT